MRCIGEVLLRLFFSHILLKYLPNYHSIHPHQKNSLIKIFSFFPTNGLVTDIFSKNNNMFRKQNKMAIKQCNHSESGKETRKMMEILLQNTRDVQYLLASKTRNTTTSKHQQNRRKIDNIPTPSSPFLKHFLGLPNENVVICGLY